jgi:hypothetical protein
VISVNFGGNKSIKLVRFHVKSIRCRQQELCGRSAYVPFPCLDIESENQRGSIMRYHTFRDTTINIQTYKFMKILKNASVQEMCLQSLLKNPI